MISLMLTEGFGARFSFEAINLQFESIFDTFLAISFDRLSAISSLITAITTPRG